MAIEHTSSKSHHSHSRSRRATVPARRRGRVTRRAHKKKIRVARRRGRGPASARVVRARRPVALSFFLSLPSRHPRVSRRGGPTRARLARARRGVVAFARRRGRATDDASARGAVARWTASIHRCDDSSERGETLCAFARRVDGSRSSHRVVRTLDCVAPRARGRVVVVASTESNAHSVSSSVSSLTTGCPPSANQSINQSLSRSGTASREVDAPRRRAFAMRSRSRSSHPSTRLDSTRDTDTGASVRAELEQTPPPPPRVPPSTEPSTTTRHPRHASTDRTRSIDRSIDRRASLDSRLAVESDVFSPHAPRRRKQSSEKPPRRHATNHHTHPSSPPSRVSHASSEYRVIGFRNPAPRVPSRHRASTHERFTNRIIIHRVTSIVTRATDGGPRPDTHTHTHEGV